MRAATAATAVAAAAVAIAGCSSSSHPSSSSSTKAAGAATAATNGAITIDTTDNFRFVPANITARPGPLRITLTDSGSYPHNLSFPSLHMTSKTVSGSPGQQSTTFTIDAKPGTYDFVCTFHSSAGMKGRLVVK